MARRPIELDLRPVDLVVGLAGMRETPPATDDSIPPGTELPIDIRVALAVVEAATAVHLALTKRRSEAGDEILHTDSPAGDIFADFADRARSPAGPAVRVARPVPRPSGRRGGSKAPRLPGGGEFAP
jgi:hypothetical protein